MNGALWDENSEEGWGGGVAKGLGNISCPPWVKAATAPFTDPSHAA